MEAKTQTSPTTTLLWILTGVYAVGYMATYSMNVGIAGWYMQANKPPWAAPIWVYVPTVTVLHGLIGVAAWSVRPRAAGGNLRPALLIWIELLLASGWALLLFQRQAALPALVLGVLDLPILAWAITATAMTNMKAASFLVPQAAWRLYALALTASLWWLNTPHGKT